MSIIIRKKIYQNGSILISVYEGLCCSVAGNYFPPFSLRVSEDLIDKIKLIAAKNKRSANKEIEYVLEKYVEEYEKLNGAINPNQE